jgi:Mn2+/Fe2+ NRAMP family transporter
MRVLRTALWLYALGAVLVAIPVAFAFGSAGDLAGTTSGKALAGALLVLSYGALRASHNPWRHRVIVQMLILFAVFAALAVTYRLVFEGHARGPAALVLVVCVAAVALLTAFYPRPPQAPARRSAPDR